MCTAFHHLRYHIHRLLPSLVLCLYYLIIFCSMRVERPYHSATNYWYLKLAAWTPANACWIGYNSSHGWPYKYKALQEIKDLYFYFFFFIFYNKYVIHTCSAQLFCTEHPQSFSSGAPFRRSWFFTSCPKEICVLFLSVLENWIWLLNEIEYSFYKTMKLRYGWHGKKMLCFNIFGGSKLEQIYIKVWLWSAFLFRSAKQWHSLGFGHT